MGINRELEASRNIRAKLGNRDTNKGSYWSHCMHIRIGQRGRRGVRVTGRVVKGFIIRDIIIRIVRNGDSITLSLEACGCDVLFASVEDNVIF